MVIKNIEIRPKGDGTYPDVLYPRTSIPQVDGLQIALDAKSPTSHTHALVTTAVAGLMDAPSFVKLNGIASNANNYVHPSGSGNNHIPAGGATNQFLKYSVAGTATWAGITASNVAIVDSGAKFVATEVEGALSELFTFANDGKTSVANAVTAKGVTASSADTFSTLATKIGQISTGKKFASGTITSSSTRLTFPSSTNGASMEYYVNVTGLTFTPSVILLKRNANDFNLVVYDARLTSYPIWNDTPMYYVTGGNVIINSTTFQIPCPASNMLMSWIAFE